MVNDFLRQVCNAIIKWSKMEDFAVVIQQNHQNKWLAYGTVARLNFCFRPNLAEEYFSMHLYAQGSPLKAISHLTISMHGQHEMGKIQRNNYHHGNCRPSSSSMGKTSSMSLIFTYQMHRNVKNGDGGLTLFRTHFSKFCPL